MTDLHELILAAIDAETALAEAASPGPWSWRSGAITVHTADIYTLITADRAADAAYVARVADPASTLRRLAEDRDVLARHTPVQEFAEASGPNPAGWLMLCAHEWDKGDGRLVRWADCPEVRSILRRHGIPIDP